MPVLLSMEVAYGRVIPRLFNMEKPSSLPSRKALFTHMKDTNRSMADKQTELQL